MIFDFKSFSELNSEFFVRVYAKTYNNTSPKKKFFYVKKRKDKEIPICIEIDNFQNTTYYVYAGKDSWFRFSNNKKKSMNIVHSLPKKEKLFYTSAPANKVPFRMRCGQFIFLDTTNLQQIFGVSFLTRLRIDTPSMFSFGTVLGVTNDCWSGQPSLQFYIDDDKGASFFYDIHDEKSMLNKKLIPCKVEYYNPESLLMLSLKVVQSNIDLYAKNDIQFLVSLELNTKPIQISF